MKRNCLHIFKPSYFFALVAILGCTLLTNSVVAQSASVAPGDPITTDAYPTHTTWKNSVDYAAVLVAERANAALTLATPNLKQTKVGLYTGYDRMLAYMQVDLGAGVPIEDIASKNFKRVTLETPGDPVLNNMQPTEFAALYDALVVMLTQ